MGCVAYFARVRYKEEQMRRDLKELHAQQTLHTEAIMKSLFQEGTKLTTNALVDDLPIQCDITPAVAGVDEVNFFSTMKCTPFMFDNNEDNNRVIFCLSALMIASKGKK